MNLSLKGFLHRLVFDFRFLLQFQPLPILCIAEEEKLGVFLLKGQLKRKKNPSESDVELLFYHSFGTVRSELLSLMQLLTQTGRRTDWL